MFREFSTMSPSSPESELRLEIASGSAACFLTWTSTVFLDLAVANGHIDETRSKHSGEHRIRATSATLPHRAAENFEMWRMALAADSKHRKWGGDWAYGDFDRDGDLDILMTRTMVQRIYTERSAGAPSERSILLARVEANRDAIGASVRIFYEDKHNREWVRGGSSYLSPIGVANHIWTRRARDKIDRNGE